MADESGSGARPQGSETGSEGARPTGEGQDTGSGATPGDGSTEGAKPDTQKLDDGGRAALDSERARRREAERKAGEYRNRVAELEDASKPELERAQAQAQRAQAQAEASTARVAELEAEIQRRDLDALKAQVAAENELPASMIGRLQGTDLRSLRTDAKDLAEQLKGARAGSFRVGEGGTAAGRTGRVDMNSIIREAAGRG